MTRVGFVGLGSQGGPMARRIIDAGYPTTLWARRPETLEPFADTAAAIAAYARGARRGVRRAVHLRRRRRRGRRGPARPRRRARHDGRRRHRRRAQHRAPHDLPPAPGRLPGACASSTRRSAAAATRRLRASSLVMVGGPTDVVERAGPSSRPSAIRSCTSGRSAPARRPSSSTTQCSPPSWPWPPRCSSSPPPASSTRPRGRHDPLQRKWPQLRRRGRRR